MFTGIIETIGSVIEIKSDQTGKHFLIKPLFPFDTISIGESIAINGVCLTVTHVKELFFGATAVPETLRLTNLSQLNINDMVNLERSLKYGERVSGHLVQGHVDGMGQIISLDDDHLTNTNHIKECNALLVKIKFPIHLQKYLINKGYIALDGMSITIIDITTTWFSVTFIPHTKAITIINHYKKGSLINIEVDMMGKYVEKFARGYPHASSF